MTRKFLGVIAGYSIFIATSLAFFKLSEHDPHSDSTTIFIILSATYGALFLCIAGFIT